MQCARGLQNQVVLFGLLIFDSRRRKRGTTPAGLPGRRRRRKRRRRRRGRVLPLGKCISFVVRLTRSKPRVYSVAVRMTCAHERAKNSFDKGQVAESTYELYQELVEW